MLDEEDGIVRFAALAMVKSESKAKEREAEEVSADIRARMEAELSEREGGGF